MKKLLTILFLIPFLAGAQITYFGSASNPADNGTASTGQLSVTPPSSMLEGDLVLVYTHSRTASNTHDIGNWGGQVWKSLTAGSTTNSTARTFWCRFNGAWLATAADFTFVTTTSTSVIMHVFRGPGTSSWWSIDVAQATSTYSAPSTPFTVSRTGQTTVADTTVTVAAWYSVDDNTWGNISGTGWVVTGGAQYRNLAGSDNSATFAHKLQTAQAATGTVSKRQTALGGDAGQTSIVTFKCSRTPRTGLVYYIGPSGSDGNAGTSIGSPFRNWQKLSDVAQRGDSIYILDGTYVPTTSMALYIHCLWELLEGTSTQPIVICNYPGASPVYDFTGYTTTRVGGTEALYIERCNFLKIKGLRITGFNQISTGSGVSRGMIITQCSKIDVERCEVDHMGGAGFWCANSNDVTYLNSDSHHNADPYSPGDPWGGTDGFASAGGEASSRTTYIGCRAWWNSDDGWDFFQTDGVRTMINCWSFWNGYQPGTFTAGGNGTGFKLGPTNTDKSSDTTKFLYSCLAFENRLNGFSQNGNGNTLYKVYNCTSYKNVLYGFWWGEYPSLIQDLQNNIGWDNAGGELQDNTGNAQGSHNTWNGVVTVNNSDFVSVSSTGMDGARQSDGSLPVLTFLHLIAGSDLINAGTELGYGSDMGPFQYVGTTRYVGRIF